MEREKTVMEEEAIRLKTLAEQSYISSDLKSALKLAKKSLRLCPHLDGTSDLITAFTILRSGAAVSTVDDSPDWYKILQIEPFSHINVIKKQYKKLALVLHPDKNPFAASEEAFKLVGDAFRVLSDKIRRKEYDVKLRIALQEKEVVEIGKEGVEVFWTACSTCRLLHQFERKYLGHSLMCPSCKKSFKAVEFSDNVDNNNNINKGVDNNVDNDNDKGVDNDVENVVGEGGGVGERMRIGRSRGGDSEVRQKTSSVGEILRRGEGERIDRDEVVEEIGGLDSVVLSGDGKGSLVSGGGSVNEGLRSKRVRKPRDLDKLDGWSSVGSVVSGRLKAKRAKIGGDEMMTIAEMQTLAKKKGGEKNLKLNEKEKEKEKEKVKERKETSDVSIGGSLETEKKSSSKKGTQSKASKSGGKEIMTGEDLDIVESGEERSERSSRKGEKAKERKETSELTNGRNLESEKKSSSKNGTSSRASSRNGTLSRASKSGHLDILTMEELDLYDFDEDGTESIFRKGEKVKNRKEASELTNGGNLETGKKSLLKKGTSSRAPKSGHMEIMTVEESDFYDFDKDRAERSFRKGQVWAIFDDDDGMPRQYALIDDVVSVNPFEVRLSWLDLQNDEDANWEKLGFCICCGRFKVSRKFSVNLLNIFSHVVDCDRVARELYRIYPKKGSVWALYNENAIDSEGGNLCNKDRRCYDIAVFLTSYSEVHGLSMGYLEKVDGLKSVFKRKDVGGHAIRWLEKDDIRLFSHQIPARKLSGEEASIPAKDCWELDPASVPPELLAISWGR